jgi:hypothetical protein
MPPLVLSEYMGVFYRSPGDRQETLTGGRRIANSDDPAAFETARRRDGMAGGSSTPGPALFLRSTPLGPPGGRLFGPVTKSCIPVMDLALLLKSHMPKPWRKC